MSNRSTEDTDSHYSLLAKLGGGSMGVAYRPEDTSLAHFAGVKFLSEEFSKGSRDLKCFHRAGRHPAALNHPTSGVIQETGEHGGQPRRSFASALQNQSPGESSPILANPDSK